MEKGRERGEAREKMKGKRGKKEREGEKGG